MSRITDEYLSEVCRTISRGFGKGAFPMLDGVQVSWAVWLRHALDLDHIDTLEARVAELEGALQEAKPVYETAKNSKAVRDGFTLSGSVLYYKLSPHHVHAALAAKADRFGRKK